MARIALGESASAFLHSAADCERSSGLGWVRSRARTRAAKRDRCLHLGPISHGSGYLFVPIWVWGGCNVMLDRFEASAAVEIMERERIG